MEHTVTTLNRPDKDFDIKLRPSKFADFTGQDKIKALKLEPSTAVEALIRMALTGR